LVKKVTCGPLQGGGLPRVDGPAIPLINPGAFHILVTTKEAEQSCTGTCVSPSSCPLTTRNA
jgi:hypothetical protein